MSNRGVHFVCLAWRHSRCVGGLRRIPLTLQIYILLYMLSRSGFKVRTSRSAAEKLSLNLNLDREMLYLAQSVRAFSPSMHGEDEISIKYFY